MLIHVRVCVAGHSGLAQLEAYAFSKSKFLNAGPLDETTFVMLKTLASHLEDARSVSATL